MRIKLEEDDFEGFYETGNLVANLGVSLERAAETEDVGFKSALRGLAQGLAELGGGQISTDFMPLRTQNVLKDYFAMKAHHSAYLEDAVANVVSEGVDLIQYCP